MKNVPRGLLVAILVGMLAGLILGCFVTSQSNNEQLVFQEGYSISIVTEKIDFELGEQVHIKIVNSGTMPLTFSSTSSAGPPLSLQVITALPDANASTVTRP